MIRVVVVAGTVGCVALAALVAAAYVVVGVGRAVGRCTGTWDPNSGGLVDEPP